MKGTVFGIQRSGTNFTETLLREHFQLNIVNADRNYIWKHSHNIELSRFEPDHFHVYIIKYPYSWVESIRRKQVDIIKRHPEIKPDKETKIQLCKDIDLYKLTKLYNDHALWWHSDAVKEHAKYIYLQYESLIRSDDALKTFLKTFQSTYNVHTKADIDKVVKHPQKVSQSDAWSEEKRDMYLRMTLPTLTWPEVDLINSALSDEFFEKTGYKKITSDVELLQNHK